MIDSFSNVKFGGYSGDFVTVALNLASTHPELLRDFTAMVIAYDNNRENDAKINAELAAIKLNEAEIATLKNQIAQLHAQLSQLTIPSWPELIEALKSEGLYEWAAEAIQIDPNLIDEVAEMRAAGEAGDRLGVIANFSQIAAIYPPTADRAMAWQKVLNDRGIPKNLLAFI